MDVVINSQIQSPLVRTLARTKGKSQSFTHNIADNVAPCSFSKIQLASQNQGETQYGRNYKIKIPQYGYLRDVILKFTTQERSIDAKVIETVQPLYKTWYTALEDVRVAGTLLAVANPAISTAGVDSDTAAARTSSCDITWFNAQNLLRGSGNGYDSNDLDEVSIVDIAPYLVPQFEKLVSAVGTLTTVQNGNNGFTNMVTNGDGAPALVTAASSIPATTEAGPYTQLLKLNGTPAMWSAHFRLYFNIYKLASKSTLDGNGNVVWTYPLAKMVWDALVNEPVQYVSAPLVSGHGVTTPATKTAGVIKATAGTLSTLTASNVAFNVNCTLPRNIVAISRAGQTYWIPKIPQFRWDANGTIVGVDFVPLHLLHPNDNGDSITDITLISKLTASTTNSPFNYRQFSIGSGGGRNDDFNTWDWQSESYYYPGLAANVAERVQLSTHNRPIQTIFPQETFARIQMFEPAERARYLKMMQARVSQSGTCTGDSTGKPGQKVMYLPLFLASTENPSFNFDTRFVEQLDIDVLTNSIDKVFVSSDVSSGTSTLLSLESWFDAIRAAIFAWDWKFTVTATGAVTIGPPVGAAPATGTYTDYVDATSLALRSALSATSAIDKQPDAYAVYASTSVRTFILGLRNFQSVPDNYIKVEALTYFHNFHDATAQAIRDSNFKPGTPASLLQYNTYLETVRPITLKELQTTTPIPILITTNNLVNGITFFVRRRFTNLALANKRDHLMQTLPLKEVTLTASGQQLYHAELDEGQLTDVFNYPLASGAIGRKYNRSNLGQAIADPVTGETVYVYHIPFGFSSDMTYNSGSVAFQTLNNPVLTLTVDVGQKASRPFNVTGASDMPEWEAVVLHNYWQMVRIDSNTGAITRSLDL